MKILKHISRVAENGGTGPVRKGYFVDDPNKLRWIENAIGLHDESVQV